MRSSSCTRVKRRTNQTWVIKLTPDFITTRPTPWTTCVSGEEWGAPHSFITSRLQPSECLLILNKILPLTRASTLERHFLGAALWRPAAHREGTRQEIPLSCLIYLIITNVILSYLITQFCWILDSDWCSMAFYGLLFLSSRPLLWVTDRCYGIISNRRI